MKIPSKILIKTMSVLIALLGVLTFSVSTMLANCSYEAPDTVMALENGENAKEAYNFLIAGTDKGGGRTDVILLAHLSARDKSASIVSIPRDTYIATKRSSKKINSCNAVGGAEELCVAVEQTLGIPVHYYAIIDLSVFSQLVDLVGGVELNLSRDMYYVDSAQGLYIDLKAGSQVLNGKEAECFVRFRSGYAMADLTRIEAQKIFIASFAKTLLSAENIAKLPAIISTVCANMQTDIEAVRLISIAAKFIGVDLDNIKIFTLPGEAYTKNGVSYYTLYKEETLALINERFNESGIAVKEENTTMTELGRIANNKFDTVGKSLAELVGEETPKK